MAEVDLNQEEVVVDRDVRATEQVNLGKKTHTDERQVTEQVVTRRSPWSATAVTVWSTATTSARATAASDPAAPRR